jgi:phenylalanyl-tRNA synthetase beta chain
VKISCRWLARHVDLSGISPEEIGESLTLSTAEVEGLERFLPHLSDVVVGYVARHDRHPAADKLSVCLVDVGGPETLGIVCGASNVAAGQKVAVARIGTKLSADLTIKKAKIRGVESCGMICSERELGLGDEHSGIWVLPADAPVGKPVAEALGLEDWILSIDNKSLTHRPDLWGHRGIASEIAAIHRRSLKPFDPKLPQPGRGRPFPVRVESKACSRYVAVPIDGVGSAAARRSPDWLRALLLAVGQRPIDLLVDLSNFVMLDLGQPNHVFDRERLSPEGIVVRMARAGERMKTLDGLERALAVEDLLICSGAAPVALAGIMGGEGSKVSGETRSLLLEVATFQPAVIRRTAQRLALRTDSSARFEKSLDPTLPMKAAAHLVSLLRELEPGLSIPAAPTDAGEWTDPALTIRLRGARVRQLLGAEVPDAEIEDILARLGFGVSDAGGALSVRVPSARATKDVTIEQDLVEEVGRIHRYGRIPERTLAGDLAPPPRDERRALVRALQDRLSGAARFHETISYSFLPDGLLEKLGTAAAPHVQVVNAAAEGLSRVRRSVLPSLLAALSDNRRRSGEVRLYEVGKGYLPERAGPRGEPFEVHQLALVWAASPPAKDARFDAGRLNRLQGVVDDLFETTERERPRWRLSTTPPAWAHPGRCLEADCPRDAEPVATLAALEPALARRLGLTGELQSDVACAEISIDALLAGPRRKVGYLPIPRFPPVKVDVAVALPIDVQAARLVEAIEEAGKGLVASTELFDVYAGPNLGPGRKSLALHVTLVSDSRTLTDQDVAKFLERTEREIQVLGGTLRRG